jgi:hypothetical protein
VNLSPLRQSKLPFQLNDKEYIFQFAPAASASTFCSSLCGEARFNFVDFHLHAAAAATAAAQLKRKSRLFLMRVAQSMDAFIKYIYK